MRLASSSDDDCQNDVTFQTRPTVTTFNISVADTGRSCTKTSSRHSRIGQNLNYSRRTGTRLPLMSHGNMTTSDRGMTSPAARVHSDVGNQGKISGKSLYWSLIY